MAEKAPRIPLPTDWPKHVKSGVLHVIALAQLALTAARAQSAKKRGTIGRLRADLEAANREISLLEEELRLKDVRMQRLPPRRRPHYRGTERMAILELRAARGWSKEQTADCFLLGHATIMAWMKRIDEDGENALVKIHAPVNRFPDFVRYTVQRLKVLCPTMGKKRIAQTLARAGLALSVSTVGRILKESTDRRPEPTEGTADEEPLGKTGEGRPVQSKAPNHVWEVDLTLAPTAAGFWAPWLPFAVAQQWPFAWWVACVVDHYSRRVMGFAVFSKEPKSVDVRTLLGRSVRSHGVPKYIISDKGRQFDCTDYRAWCKRKGMQPRFASTGSLRATAIIERFFLSLKDEWLRRISIPLSQEAMRRELASYASWFAEYRPHQGLDGRTPHEVYNGTLPSEVASQGDQTPQTIPRRNLVVHFHDDRRQLPIVELRRAA